MKKFLAIAVILPLFCFGAWAGAQQEEPGPEMEKIVYLTTDYHDNPEVHDFWTEEFKRISGATVELKTVSSKDAGEGMMALFMGGEHLDVVKYGEDDISPLARQEFIIPLDEFIEKSPRMKTLREMFPSSFAAHSWNGVVYGIPERSGSNRGLWVRKDILDELGLEIPRTLDELVASMKKIRDSYPGPDGQPLFPYVSKTYHHGYISVLSNYFDVSLDPAIRRPGDSKFREGWDSPQLKDYAEFVKMLWTEQLIDPGHALPQKASATRSKLYAGKGAYLAMWTNLYPDLIEGVKKNFPAAELTLVPPIVNPKGGVLGLSVVPGYRPFCITSKAANPQYVWDKFIETVCLNTEGVMLQYRGIPDITYKVVNNTFKDNKDEYGAGMKTRPPLDPNIEFPYKLSPLMETGAELEKQFDGWFVQYTKYAVVEEPSRGVAAFDTIYDDMKDKKNQLFWKFVIGEFGYEEMLTQFEAYKKEIDFRSILEEINAAQ